jgi:hypothetical protein
MGRNSIMVFTSCCILNNKQIVPTRLEEMNALSHSFDRSQIGGRNQSTVSVFAGTFPRCRVVVPASFGL